MSISAPRALLVARIDKTRGYHDAQHSPCRYTPHSHTRKSASQVRACGRLNLVTSLLFSAVVCAASAEPRDELIIAALERHRSSGQEALVEARLG